MPSMGSELGGMFGALLFLLGLWKTQACLEEAAQNQVRLNRAEAPREPSARQDAEEQRRIAAHRLQMATKAARLGIWEWNKAQGQLLWDETLRGHYGLMDAPGDFEGWASRVHPEDQPTFRQAFAAALRGDEGLDVQFRAQGSNAGLRIFRVVGQAMRDGGGKVIRLIGVNQDLTKRIEGQRALVESEARFRSLFESMSEGVALHELQRDEAGRAQDYRILDVNSAYARHTGIPEAKAKGALGSKIYGAENPPYLDVYERVARSGAAENFEVFFAPLGRHFRVSVFSPGSDHFATIFEDITEQKRAEAALQDSEARFRAIFEGSAEAMMLLDPSTHCFQDCNRAALQVFQCSSREQFLSIHPAKFSPERQIDGRDSFEKAEAMIAEALSKGSLRFDWTHCSPNREPFPAEVSLAPVTVGAQPLLVATVRDLSERKAAEQAIRSSQEKLQLLLDSTAEGIYGIDLRGCCTFCNPACVQMLGFEGPEALLGKNMHDLIHHSGRDGAPSPVQDCRIYRAFSEGAGVHVEDEVFWRADGSCFPVEYWSYPQFSGGRVTGAVVGFLDRSQREQWESEIRRLGQFLESVIQNADVWMNVLDNQANVVLWNHAAELISGYSGPEVLGNARIWEWLYPDAAYRAEIGEKVAAILTRGETVQDLETSILSKKGGARIISWNSRGLLDASGNISGSIAIGRDVTETKFAEEQLKAAEAKLRKVSNSVPVMVYQLHCLTEEDWRFAFVNERVREIYGVSPEEAMREMGSTLGQVHPEDLPEVVRSTREAFRHLSLWSMDIRATVGGRTRWHHGESVPERLPDGSVLFTGYFQDITVRKEAEQERERLLNDLAVKNKELETVVYVASHDLRSPLVNILGFSQRLEKAFGEASEIIELAPPEPLRERLRPIFKERIPAALRFIQASGTKMDGLINGLLRISRVGRAELKLEALDMEAMLKGILDSMAFQLQKSEARVTLGRVPACLGDASQVNQIFSNLIDNALKYRDPARPLQLDLWGELKDGRVICCVQDTGLGIPPGALEKVWGLFHRLDPNDGLSGEGLGLAMVQRMAARNGGRAWAESESGKGSRFFVELPAP